MLTCDKCSQELSGGTVICRSCGFNNALRRVDKWREQRRPSTAPVKGQQESSTPSSNSGNSGSLRRRIRPSSQDATLIPFPAINKTSSNTEKPQPEKSERKEPTDLYPPWRKELQERVRQSREQRTARPGEHRHHGGHDIDRNPIIESALKRINRAEYLPPITPRSGRGAAAAAMAQVEAPLPEKAVEEKPARATVLEPVAKAAAVEVKPTPVVKSEIIKTEPPKAISPAKVKFEEPQGEPFAEAVEKPAIEAVALPMPAIASEKVVFTVGPKPSCTIATLRHRAAAALIDAEASIFGYLVAFAGLMFFDITLGEAARTALIVTAAFLVPLYYTICYAFAGRTFGMSLMKLHTAQETIEEVSSTTSGVRYEIQPLSFSSILARAFGGVISLLAFPLNLFIISRHPDKLSLSDLLSSTRVVVVKGERN